MLSFLALFVFGLPFPLIILAAGVWGMVSHASPSPEGDAPLLATAPGQSLRTLALWGTLWAAPLVMGVAVLGHLG